MGWLTLDAKSVVVNDSGPRLRVRSNDALRPRSATSGTGIDRRDNPAASVSSVKGVGAKKPCPAERRLAQPFQRANTDRRGLKNVPNWLLKSTRPLAETDNHGAMVISSCRKTPGVRY